MKAPTKLDGGVARVIKQYSSESKSISGGSVYDFIITPNDIPGYTFAGIVGVASVGSGTSNLSIRRFGVYSQNGVDVARITIQNAGSNSVTVSSVNADLLYIRS